jgi:hypothetical protein
MGWEMGSGDELLFRQDLGRFEAPPVRELIVAEASRLSSA